MRRPVSTPLTLGQVLDRSIDWLKQRGSASARLDAQLLIAHALGMDRIQLYLQLERPLSEDERSAIRAMLQRRGAREPVAWIVGHKGFHDLDLQVMPGVLVPRPDTETLVDAVLSRVPAEARLFLADIGCGTGAIGLALAQARPGLKVYATDLSKEALACTRANVECLGLNERVAVLQGDLLAPIPPRRPVDIVVSNPPYVPSTTLASLEPEVREHEPRLALDGGPDGLNVYRRLVPAAAARARVGVLVEVGHDQGPAIAHLFRQAGLQGVTVLRDLGRRDRVVLGTVPGAHWPSEPSVPQGALHVEPIPTAPRAEQPADQPARDGQPALDAQPALDEQGLPLPVFDADR